MHAILRQMRFFSAYFSLILSIFAQCELSRQLDLELDSQKRGQYYDIILHIIELNASQFSKFKKQLQVYEGLLRRVAQTRHHLIIHFYSFEVKPTRAPSSSLVTLDPDLLNMRHCQLLLCEDESEAISVSWAMILQYQIASTFGKLGKVS